MGASMVPKPKNSNPELTFPLACIGSLLSPVDCLPMASHPKSHPRQSGSLWVNRIAPAFVDLCLVQSQAIRLLDARTWAGVQSVGHPVEQRVYADPAGSHPHPGAEHLDKRLAGREKSSFHQKHCATRCRYPALVAVRLVFTTTLAARPGCF